MSSSQNEMKTVIKEYRDNSSSSSSSSNSSASSSSSSSDDDEEKKKSSPPASTSKSSSKGKSSKKKSKNKSFKKRIISAKTPLESIQESESPQDTSSHMSKSNSFANKCFGVRSYLHEFYDHQSSSSNNQAHKNHANKERTRNKLLRLVWKLSFWLGFFVLMGGIALLVVGYTFGEKPIVVAEHNSLEMLDKQAIEYNNNIESCKIIGLLVFSIGGLILAASLIAPSFIFYRQCIYKDDIFESDDCHPPYHSNMAYSDSDQIKSPIKKASFEHVQPQAFSDNNIANYVYKTKNYESMSMKNVTSNEAAADSASKDKDTNNTN